MLGRFQTNGFCMVTAAILSVAVTSGGVIAQGQPAGAKPKTVVRLGVSNRPDQAFLELAFARGYFEEQGITIQTVPATSGVDFVSPLALDQLDVGSGSPNAALFNALNRKIDIRIVADFAHIAPTDDGLVSIVVRKDLADSGAIKTVADLKGRSIGAGTGRGQVGNLIIYKMLQAGKVPTSTVNLKTMNFSDALSALANKNLDVAFLIEPLITQAEMQNIAKVFLKGSAIRPNTHLAVLLYSSTFAKQTDLANRFMVAYLHGVRDYHEAFFLKKNREAAIDILMKRLPIKDRKVWENAMPQYIDVNGRVDVKDLQEQAGIYMELGDVVGQAPSMDKFVDPKFAEAAVSILGKR